MLQNQMLQPNAAEPNAAEPNAAEPNAAEPLIFLCTSCEAVLLRVHIDISESDILIGFPAPLARVWRRLMVFDRAAQHHHDRLEDTVREENTAMLEGGL